MSLPGARCSGSASTTGACSWASTAQRLSDHDMKWRTGAGYHNVSIHLDRWEWGRSHDYYDGPHDSFSLGCFHVNWQGDWCEKCANGD